jgi:hypothetical protein
MAQVVECRPDKHEALNSNCSIAEKETEREREGGSEK